MEARLDEIIKGIAYPHKNRVRAQVIEVWQQSKYLNVQKGEFIHNTGVSSELCMITGTIPIIHKSVEYNIPIEVFITLRFPYEPPKIYVRPTRDMLVTPKHPFVSPDGTVNFNPFMRIARIGQDWTSDCQMANILYYLSMHFGESPPLYTRPKPVVHPPGVNGEARTMAERNERRREQLGGSVYNPYAYSSNVSTQHDRWGQEGSSSNTAYPARNTASHGSRNPVAVEATPSNMRTATATTATYSGSSDRIHSNIPVVTATFPTSQNASTSVMQSAESRNNSVGTQKVSSNRNQLQRNLAEKLTLRIIEDVSRTSSQLHSASRDSAILQENSTNLNDIFETLRSMKIKIQEAMETMDEKHTRIEAVIKEKDNNTYRQVDPEERLKPSDALSEQIIDLSADNNACEDCLYQLDKAMQVTDCSNSSDKRITHLDEFLKETRKLAHKQFMIRAHLRKVIDNLESIDKGDKYSKDVLEYWRSSSF